MRSAKTKAIIKKIAEDEGLTIKQIEEIVYSFFRFTSKIMKGGDKSTFTFHSVRLFKFGIFKVKQGRINHLKRRNEKFNRNSKRNSGNLPGSIDDKGVQENMDKRQITEEGEST